MDIYVGNLPFNLMEDSVRATFEQYGVVANVKIVFDRETGRSKGFGFVTMPDPAEAQAAIAGLNGTPVEGRALRVNEARPRQ